MLSKEEVVGSSIMIISRRMKDDMVFRMMISILMDQQDGYLEAPAGKRRRMVRMSMRTRVGQ